MAVVVEGDGAGDEDRECIRPVHEDDADEELPHHAVQCGHGGRVNHVWLVHDPEPESEHCAPPPDVDDRRPHRNHEVHENLRAGRGSPSS